MQWPVDWELKTCERKFVVVMAKVPFCVEKLVDKPRYNSYVCTCIYKLDSLTSMRK